MNGFGVARGGPADDDPDGRGLRIRIVAARFDAEIVELLVETAREELARLGVRPEDVVLVRVPGAFELPIAARAGSPGSASTAVGR